MVSRLTHHSAIEIVEKSNADGKKDLHSGLGWDVRMEYCWNFHLALYHYIHFTMQNLHLLLVKTARITKIKWVHEKDSRYDSNWVVLPLTIMSVTWKFIAALTNVFQWPLSLGKYIQYFFFFTYTVPTSINEVNIV